MIPSSGTGAVHRHGESGRRYRNSTAKAGDYQLKSNTSKSSASSILATHPGTVRASRFAGKAECVIPGKAERHGAWFSRVKAYREARRAMRVGLRVYLSADTLQSLDRGAREDRFRVRPGDGRVRPWRAPPPVGETPPSRTDPGSSRKSRCLRRTTSRRAASHPDQRCRRTA
jgi:hypothetical protein